MDPYTEKEMVDCFKIMAISLKNIDRKLDDIALSLRDISAADGDDCADIEVEVIKKEGKNPA